MCGTLPQLCGRRTIREVLLVVERTRKGGQQVKRLLQKKKRSSSVIRRCGWSSAMTTSGLAPSTRTWRRRQRLPIGRPRDLSVCYEHQTGTMKRGRLWKSEHGPIRIVSRLSSVWSASQSRLGSMTKQRECTASTGVAGSEGGNPEGYLRDQIPVAAPADHLANPKLRAESFVAGSAAMLSRTLILGLIDRLQKWKRWAENILSVARGT